MIKINATRKRVEPEQARQNFFWPVLKWGKFRSGADSLFKPYYMVTGTGRYSLSGRTGEKIVYLSDGLDFDTIKVLGNPLELETFEADPHRIIEPRFEAAKAVSQVRDAFMRDGFFRFKEYPKVDISECRMVYRPFYVFHLTFFGRDLKLYAYGDSLGQHKVSRRV